MCYVNGHKFHIVEWGRGKKKEDNSVGFVLKAMLVREKMIGMEC